LRVVEDESGDAGFSLLSLIVGWMAILQRRIGVAERWNRRAARKREMLASEALRMNMCDRLGGIGALEAWEERARLALSYGKQAGDPVIRRGDGNSLGGEASSPRTARCVAGGTPSEEEFALPRTPGRGARRMSTRIVRAAWKHETPIPVWPCEVMPERFAREWWPERAPAQTKPDFEKQELAFPELGGAEYPESRDEEHESYGSKDRDPAAAQRDTSPGMRAGGEHGFDVGGPASSAGAIACAR